MKILKTTILYLLFLIAMIMCGTAVMKVMDAVFKLGYENIWTIGWKVGFAAWLFLSAISLFNKSKKGDTKENCAKSVE